MRSRALLPAVVTVSLLSGGSLRAGDGGPPEPGPETSAPRPVADPGVAYPRAALGDGHRDRVEVELVLTIDSGGAVTDATVARSAGEAFDEAALAAARRLRFEPARQ